MAEAHGWMDGVKVDMGWSGFHTQSGKTVCESWEGHVSWDL